jgi:hypothetical protein
LKDPETQVRCANATRSYVYPGFAVDDKDIALVDGSDGQLIHILVGMNRAGFDETPYEMTFSEILTRNSSFIRQNPRVFMLFRDPVREQNFPNEYAGYTCILPLTEEGKRKYLEERRYKDRDLPASIICQDGERADLLLFFAMHLNDKYKGSEAGKNYSRFLIRCIEHHIQLIARHHCIDAEEIDVWVQSESDNMGERYVERCYVPTSYESLEGFPFYVRRTAILHSHRTLLTSPLPQ